MTLEQLRIFAAVAETLHFTRAADALRLTQPAVSAAVAALEASCRVRLFDRIGRRVELTPAGRLLHGEARAILRRVTDAEAMLAELSGLKRGTLALAASQTVGSYWLPQHLGAFAAAFPGVRVDLLIANTHDVAEMVRDGRAELGIAEGPVGHPSLMTESIPGDRLVLVVAPSHPWAGRPAVAAAELAETAWVLREEGSGTRRLFEEALLAAGVAPDSLTPALVLPNGEAIRGAVAAGAGAAVLSELVVADDLAAGRLHRVNGLDLPARPFHLLRHRDRYRSGAERAFVQLAITGG